MRLQAERRTDFRAGLERLAGEGRRRGVRHLGESDEVHRCPRGTAAFSPRARGKTAARAAGTRPSAAEFAATLEGNLVPDASPRPRRRCRGMGWRGQRYRVMSKCPSTPPAASATRVREAPLAGPAGD